jgi:hypothetical protein
VLQRSAWRKKERGEGGLQKGVVKLAGFGGPGLAGRFRSSISSPPQACVAARAQIQAMQRERRPGPFGKTALDTVARCCADDDREAREVLEASAPVRA